MQPHFSGPVGVVIHVGGMSMDEPITDKGRVLTAMSAFGFEKVSGLIGGLLIATEGPEVEGLEIAGDDPELAGRVMLTRKAAMLPVDCIVRGAITRCVGDSMTHCTRRRSS